MRPSSAKAKGRKLQQWFTNKMVEILGLDKDDLVRAKILLWVNNQEINSLTL